MEQIYNAEGERYAKKENRMAKREVRDKLFWDLWHRVFLKAMVLIT
jgi:hypothetical protein